MTPDFPTLLWPELVLALAFLAELLLLAVPAARRWGGRLAMAAVAGSLAGVGLRAGGLGAEAVDLPFYAVSLARWQTPFLLIADVAALITLVWLRLARNPGRYDVAPLSFFTLAGLAGAHVLVIANSAILSFLALETLSLASYAGIAWAGRKDALEAGLRYALIGIFASACLVYGLSWCYGLDLLPETAGSATAWHAAQALLLVGVLFKLGAFPLHGWVAGAYQAGPLPFVAFLSVAPKVAALGWLTHLAGFAHTDLHAAAPALAAAGAASILAGNVGAFFQTRFLRLMGFSSVAHAGFMLLCLACPAPLEVAAFYSLALLGINYMAMGLWGQMQALGATDELASVNGWGRGRVWLGVLAVVSGLALAGLPPTVGFTAKFKLILGLAHEAGQFGRLAAYGLAAFAALNTAVSLYYYLRLPYHLIFRPGAEPPATRTRPVARLALLALGLALLFFFFAGRWLEALV